MADLPLVVKEMPDDVGHDPKPTPPLWAREERKTGWSGKFFLTWIGFFRAWLARLKGRSELSTERAVIPHAARLPRDKLELLCH
jgi:hypothetical protein